MNCPKCNSVLIEVERNEIELEHCIKCGGFFLNVDEWELIKQELNLPFELVDLMALPPISIKDAREEARFCPCCNERMEKINAVPNSNGKFALILDRCVKRHGVWFDKDELSKFMNLQKTGEIKSETISFLGEKFII